jgi:hypothetical protein
MVRRVFVLASWVTCGVILLTHCHDSSDAPENGISLPDRSPGKDAGTDAADSAPPSCDPKSAFQPPQLVPGLDDGQFYATPRLATDELTIYFTTVSTIDGSLQADLVSATRTSRDVPFEPAKLLTAYNTTSSDNDPTIAADYRSLWFSSARTGTNELYVATRASPSDAFGPAKLVAGAGVNGPSQEYHPYYRVAAHELWFTSDRSDASVDIYLTSETPDGSFAPPSLVRELSTPAFEAHPMVTEDGLHVLFASNRDGGAGGFDLWLAHRNSPSEAFAAPTSIPELDTASDEYGGWLSPDNCRAYFSSNRGIDGGTRHRLWYAERTIKTSP